ncbi:MAG: sigma-70 family RNA polymerase sigma factor [Rhodothermales bacterium]
MSAQAVLNSINVVAGVLPFRLDEYDRVNEVFAASLVSAEGHDSRRQVDVWTYCFVSRYFAVQFLRSGDPLWSDLDRLIDKAFIKIRRGIHELRSPAKYSSWVSTVCRNVYLNYMRSYRLEWLDDPENIVAEATTAEDYDHGLLADTLSRVIDDLPPFLREAARLRLFAGLTYREISMRTGQSIPTLRSYTNKSIKLIRRHPHLRRIFDEMGR